MSLKAKLEPDTVVFLRQAYVHSAENSPRYQGITAILLGNKLGNMDPEALKEIVALCSSEQAPESARPIAAEIQERFPDLFRAKA